jgi:PTH1 family peptidyl-tRNA hydrolase
LPPTRLVVGLGNPGPKYAGSRHNLGFAVAATLAERLSVKNFKKCPGGAPCELASAALEGTRLLLARPLTYMNRSGEAVAALLGYYRLGPDSLIVVHDDLDQELGRLKLVLSGGAGGHKGVISIAETLGTQEWRRVKVGIGRPRFAEDIEEFVLEAPYPDQRQDFAAAVERAADAVCGLITLGDSRAMSEFNA